MRKLFVPSVKQMKKSHKKPKIIFKELNETLYVPNDGWIFQWCCDCKLRHIWNLKIHRRKKKNGGDFIEVSGIDDRTGTKLRKFYDTQDER